MAKIKQSETVIIKRSQISFAPYNPRKKNKKVVEALKRNFKRVGFLGGIQWNATTGNLIGGHKRTEALDLIHGYDGTSETDYDIKVEKIELTEKQEKEQNIFLNNKRVQGEMDYEMMSVLVQEIDIDEAGLEQYDIDLIETLVPDFSFGKNEDIKTDIEDLRTPSEKKQNIKDLKKNIKSNIGQSHLASYEDSISLDIDKNFKYTVDAIPFQATLKEIKKIGFHNDLILGENDNYFILMETN